MIRTLHARCGVVAVLLILWATPLLSATRLYYEDFESSGWEAGFRGGDWSGHVARTTNHPQSGSYCLRGQAMDRADPITKLTGIQNPQLECDFGGISSHTPNEVFVRYYIRFDDANWTNISSDTGEVLATDFYGKFAYLTDDKYGLGFMWFNWGANGGNPGAMHLEPNGGPYSDPWLMENWAGNFALYSMPSGTIGIDGQWHKVEIYLNYTENYAMFWGDGVLSTKSVFPDGEIPIHPESHLRGIQFWHFAFGTTEDSTDGPPGEYACGWQIDNIEVWDGLPDQTSDPEGPGQPGQPESKDI